MAAGNDRKLLDRTGFRHSAGVFGPCTTLQALHVTAGEHEFACACTSGRADSIGSCRTVAIDARLYRDIDAVRYRRQELNPSHRLCH